MYTQLLVIMAIRNLKDSSKKPWLCECYPQGRSGKRIRKRFTMNEVDDKPWLGEKDDTRRVSNIIELRYKTIFTIVPVAQLKAMAN